MAKRGGLPGGMGGFPGGMNITKLSINERS